MKSITLTKQQLRIVSLNLDQEEKGLTRQELRKLDKIQTEMIEPLLKDFNAKIEVILSEGREKFKQLDKENANLAVLLQSINQETTDKVEEISKGVGKEIIEVKLEDDYFSFVKSHFLNDQKMFLTNKESRRMVLDIEDALENVTTTADSPLEAAKKKKYKKTERGKKEKKKL